MARHPRIDLPDVAQHIIQRGNNRLPCFLDGQDRQCYLHRLGEALSETGCQLHAYVLMDNHVHLLLTPPEAGAVARLMQQLGRCYVGWFNARHGRSGTLWEGRYKSCLVDSDAYLLHCYRYIELNPVRALMVARPTDFPWSSCRVNCGHDADPLLAPHPCYQSLGSHPAQRTAAYRRLIDQQFDDALVAEIRTYLQQQRALGRDSFRAMVEARTCRFAGIRPSHRPRHRPRRCVTRGDR